MTVDESQSIVIDYKPHHPYFAAFHARTKRYSVLVAHRRAGKTYAVVRDLVARALNFAVRNPKTGQVWSRPRFAYYCPLKAQAKQVAWDYLLEFTRGFPGLKTNASELWVEFQTRLGDKAKIFVAGADNPDNIRGLYWNGVVLDEFADMKGDELYSSLMPALSDRGGWVVFMGTPKGKNHLYDMIQEAQKKPDEFFSFVLKASHSGLVNAKELANLQARLEPEEYAQEMECDFTASFKGTYYGNQIGMAEAQNRFDTCPYVEHEQVHCAMDIGRNDATAIWFYQFVNGRIQIFDYFEQSGLVVDDVIDKLVLLGAKYDYKTIWLPHDAKANKFDRRKNVLTLFKDAGLPARIARAPVEGRFVIDGISQVRRFFQLYHFIFDRKACAIGIDCLKFYSRKFNSKQQVFVDEPNHNVYSHGADAFRYLCASLDDAEIGLSVERERFRVFEKMRGNAGVNKQNRTYGELLASHESKQRARRRGWRAI